jgi:putative endonuclease
VWTVYALKSLKTGRLYVGMSKDVLRRLGEHNTGRSKLTSGHTLWVVVY